MKYYMYLCKNKEYDSISYLNCYEFDFNIYTS